MLTIELLLPDGAGGCTLRSRSAGRGSRQEYFGAGIGLENDPKAQALAVESPAVLEMSEASGSRGRRCTPSAAFSFRPGRVRLGDESKSL